MLARKYAQYLGIVLLLLAFIGFILGDNPLLGVLNIDIQEDIIHLLSGAILLYVGFNKSEPTAANVAGALGLIYLIIGFTGFVTPDLIGILQHEYSLLDNLIHISIGIMSVIVYKLSSSKTHTN